MLEKWYLEYEKSSGYLLFERFTKYNLKVC